MVASGFTNLLTGLAPSGGFSGLLTGFTGGNTNSGGLSLPAASSGSAGGGGLLGLLGNAVSGGAAGASVGGPYGAAIGAALSVVTGLFSGNHPAPGHEKPDIVAIANTNKISEEDAGKVVEWQANHSGDAYDNLAAYLSGRDRGDGGGQAYFLRLVNLYNTANPGTPVVLGSAASAAVSPAQQQQLVTGLQGAGVSLSQASSLVSSFASGGNAGQSAGDMIKQILSGALSGAVTGGAVAAANTQLGQQATNATIKSYAKDYQLLIAGGAVGIGALIYLAFKNR